MLSMIIGIMLLCGGVFLFFKLFYLIMKLVFSLILAVPLFVILMLVWNGPILVMLAISVLIALAIKAIRGNNDTSSGSYSSGNSYTDTGYVLNWKSGVMHRPWDSSVNTISDYHKTNISSYRANELAGRGGKFRFKRDSY